MDLAASKASTTEDDVAVRKASKGGNAVLREMVLLEERLRIVPGAESLLLKKFGVLSEEAPSGRMGKNAVENSGALDCECLGMRALLVLPERIEVDLMSSGAMHKSTLQAAGEVVLLIHSAEIGGPAAKGEADDVVLVSWVSDGCGQATVIGQEAASAAESRGRAVTWLMASSGGHIPPRHDGADLQECCGLGGREQAALGHRA